MEKEPPFQPPPPHATSPPVQFSEPPPLPPATSLCLAPGFRFHPTDEELVTYYLRRKVSGKPFRIQAVVEIDVYKYEPWELAVFSSLKTRDEEWYFFSPVDKKYVSGSRLNRSTEQGFWKATGKDRYVCHQNQVTGMKKTLVFHTGRAPNGKRTDWVMHEYRLADEDQEKGEVPQHAFVLCRIFHKGGLGSQNSGNRYAPFIEEEWEDDDNATLVVPGGEAEEETMVTGYEIHARGKNIEQEIINLDTNSKDSIICNTPTKSHNFAIISKRGRSEEAPHELSLSQPKISKHGDPSSSKQVHCSAQGSTTTNRDIARTKNTESLSSNLLEFPVLEPKEGATANPPSFDSSNLEKYVPPGYLKFISNLESNILDMSMEKETLKLEVMRAQAMINGMESRIAILGKENEDLKRISQSR